MGGTLEVLRLAVEGKPKRVHYVSSLSVFGGGSNEVGEREPLPPLAEVVGGFCPKEGHNLAARILAGNAPEGNTSYDALSTATGGTGSGGT